MAGTAAVNGDDINFQLFCEVEKKTSSIEHVGELLLAGANPFFVPYPSQIREENGAGTVNSPFLPTAGEYTPLYLDPEVKNYANDCAVSLAVRENNVELVKLLLHFDGKLFRERSLLEKFQLYAMLCETCEFNILNVEMIRVLLEYGVWVNDPNFNYRTDELKDVTRRTLYYGCCSPYSSCMYVHVQNFFLQKT